MATVFVRVAAVAGASVAAAFVLTGCGVSSDQPAGTGPTTASPVSTPPVSTPPVSTTPAPTPPISTALSSALWTDGTYTGDPIQTPHGAVQVEIVVTNQRISDIHVIQCPSDAPQSILRCQQAVPVLIDRSLAAQSADIDSVSGATFTSRGYKQSLQSAIDQAER